MKRVCGFGLFCFALGMLVMIIVANEILRKNKDTIETLKKNIIEDAKKDN